MLAEYNGVYFLILTKTLFLFQAKKRVLIPRSFSDRMPDVEKPDMWGMGEQFSRLLSLAIEPVTGNGDAQSQKVNGVQA